MKIHHIRNKELIVTVHLLMKIRGHQIDSERNKQEGDITQRKEKKTKNPKSIKVLYVIASIYLYIYIITGHKRQRSEDSNSDEQYSFRKHKSYSEGSDSSLDSN